MNNPAVPTDSRYIPLTQQKYCCVPTCIQMILLRRGIPLPPAELIGSYLGLIVDDKSKKYFWNVETGDRPSSGYGTRISLPKYSPQVALDKLSIPLKFSLNLVDNFHTLDEFIEYLADPHIYSKDVLICFDWPTLFDPSLSDHWGHVCVLDIVDIPNMQIRIIDPDYNSSKWKIVSIERLYQSMKMHGNSNSGGFWEFTN